MLWYPNSVFVSSGAIREMTALAVLAECWLLSNCQNLNLIPVKGCATEDREGTSVNLQCTFGDGHFRGEKEGVRDRAGKDGNERENETGRWGWGVCAVAVPAERYTQREGCGG